MNDFSQHYRLLKLAGTGVLALLLGVGLIIAGDLQSIVAGCGALLASVIVFAFLGWNSVSAKRLARQGAEESSLGSRASLVWLGLGLTFAPGALYFYLRFAMNRFDPFAVLFLSVPLLVSGIGCLVIGLWSKENKADEAIVKSSSPRDIEG